MPSLTLPSSASTETLLLKCQKETHKPPLPPTWSSYPPNQEIHPPRDTLALAIRIDAAAPTSICFYESATNRPVGSLGPEYRGSLVLVPWRTGLKFVVAPTCRRRNGSLVGVIREGKGAAVLRETPVKKAPQVATEMSPTGIPPTVSRVTANMKVKVTPQMNPNVTARVAGHMKSYIPVAVRKKSTGLDDDGNVQRAYQGQPSRHGTAIPSPTSNSGSRRRKHVSLDNKVMMGKPAIKMAVLGY